MLKQQHPNYFYLETGKTSANLLYKVEAKLIESNWIVAFENLEVQFTKNSNIIKLNKK